MENIINKISEFTLAEDRLSWITNLLNELKIEYFIDEYGDEEKIRNICIPGTNSKMIIAHYDVLNIDSDNANDNSASVINAIALKYLNKDINIVLTDGEEIGCEGAKQLSRLLVSERNPFGNIDWILNLELTGLGENVCVSNYSNGKLNESISQFNVLNKDLPLNDAHYLNKKGFDSEVVATYPTINGEDNFDHFHRCHEVGDDIDSIKKEDMIKFVTEFLYPLTK